MVDPASDMARAIGELSALLTRAEVGHAPAGGVWVALRAVEEKLAAAFGGMIGGEDELVVVEPG